MNGPALLGWLLTWWIFLAMIIWVGLGRFVLEVADIGIGSLEMVAYIQVESQ